MDTSTTPYMRYLQHHINTPSLPVYRFFLSSLLAAECLSWLDMPLRSLCLGGCNVRPISSILKLSMMQTSILYPFAARFCSHRSQMLSPTLCFYHINNLRCPSIDSDFNSSTYLILETVNNTSSSILLTTPSMVHVACRSDTDTHHLLLLFRY